MNQRNAPWIKTQNSLEKEEVLLHYSYRINSILGHILGYIRLDKKSYHYPCYSVSPEINPNTNYNIMATSPASPPRTGAAALATAAPVYLVGVMTGVPAVVGA